MFAVSGQPSPPFGRSASVWAGGRRCDQVMYDMTHSEWEGTIPPVLVLPSGTLSPRA